MSKPSAVLRRLGLLEAVEGSRHCVACRPRRASPDCQPQNVHPGIKRSCGRKNVGAPETEPPCMHLDCAVLGYPEPSCAMLIGCTTISHAFPRTQNTCMRMPACAELVGVSSSPQICRLEAPFWSVSDTRPDLNQIELSLNLLK